MRTRLGLLSLACVLGELKAHVQEVGKANWGPSVSKYLHGAGVDVPAPWCAALQDWGIDRASALVGIPNPIKIKNQAYVQAYVEFAFANKLMVPAGLARPGDLVAYAFDPAHPTHFDHIGALMTKVVGDHFHAVEGNTNDDGSREGYKVADKSRIYKVAKTVFIAYDKQLPQYEGDFADVLSILDEYGIQA